MRRDGEIIQESLTDSYFLRTSSINSSWLDYILPFLDREQSVLYKNDEHGNMISKLRDYGITAEKTAVKNK